MEIRIMRLKQKKLFEGSQTLEIVENNIKIQGRKFFQTTEFHIPIRFLSKDPIHYKKVCIASIGALVFFLLIAIALAVLLVVSEYPQEAKDVLIGFLVITSVICVICAIKVKTAYTNQLIYTSLFTGETVFVLLCNRPDEETFQKFVTELDKKILKIYEEQSATGLAGDSLADEISKLKKLMEEGDISEPEFNAAKVKLLSTEGDEWKFS
jgi:hypothetical protein